MKWFRKKHNDRAMPFIVYRREKQMVWTKEDADSVNRFLSSPVGIKLMAFMEDVTINRVLKGAGKDIMTGWKEAIQTLVSYRGEQNYKKPSSTNEDHETTNMQFLEDEETTTA